MSLRQLSHEKCRSWECVLCCERAKRALIGRKYQFSNTMFSLPTTWTLVDSLMGFILRFHEIYIVESAKISLGSVCLLRDLHSAFKRPNAMEGLVVVSYTRFASKARSKWLLRGVSNEVTQSQGQRGFILTVEVYLTMISIIP